MVLVVVVVVVVTIRYRDCTQKLTGPAGLV